MTWVYLRHASDRSLGLIHSVEKGIIDIPVDPLLEGIKALLCRAAALEGFVNAIGAQRCPKHWWTAIDKRSVTEKIQLLEKDLGLSIDFGSAPFSHWRRIRQFRNGIVHPRRDKSDEVVVEHDLNEAPLDFPKLDWERECTDNLLENCDAIDQMIHQLELKSGYRHEGTSTGQALEMKDSEDAS